MNRIIRQHPRRGTFVLLSMALLLLLGASAPALAQDSSNQSQGERDNSQPPPPSVGSDVTLPYFAPPPSMVQKELIGPYQLLKSGKIDMDAMTITLPLYKGQMKDGGKEVWYILTDTNDKGNADALGINYSAKFSYAAVGKAIRHATLEKDTTLTFDAGTVDFSPERKITPGDGLRPYPPKTAEPGSVGDADYSPLIQIENTGGQIYNAPVVAFGSSADQLNAFCDGSPDFALVHDHVRKICPKEMTVTMALTTGFSFGRPVLYLSTDANDATVAALEDATLAPGLKDITVGHDDGAFSAIERIFITTNGQTGLDNPQRQGLDSAIGDQTDPSTPISPLNVFGGIPTVATDYSPLWDGNIVEWTDKAIAKGYRARVHDEFEILGLVRQGWLTGPDGKAFGSSGVIIDCAVAMRLL